MWTSGRDEEGPFLKLGDQWVGYDDPISVKIKSAYVRFTKLGGVSLWSLDLDDFQVYNFFNTYKYSCTYISNNIIMHIIL